MGVIVPQSVNDDQLSRIKDIVGAAVGFNAERGDAITVEPLSRILTDRKVPSVAAAEPETPAPAPVTARTDNPTWKGSELATSAALMFLAVVLVELLRRLGTESSADKPAQVQPEAAHGA